MSKMLKSFLLMITFLTRIPFPVTFEFDPQDFVRGNVFFPVIGGIVGLLMVPVLFVQSYIPKETMPFLIILIYLLIVGGIHIDGIGDLFDGIFSARKKERMLEIMEDSHVGAFGVIGLILYFMGFYIGIYGILEVSERFVILVFMPIVGRSMALIAASVSRYAKKDGLGKSLVDKTKVCMGVLVAFILSASAFIYSIQLGCGVVLTILLGLFLVRRIHKTLDGITGDVVGAMVEISQIIFLVTMGIVLKGNVI